MVFSASNLGVWLWLRAVPRKLKREKVQNPTSAKIATLENFPLYGTQLYQTFLTSNHITDREPLPRLQRKLTTNSPTPTPNPPALSTLSVSLQPPVSSTDTQPIHKKERENSNTNNPPIKSRKNRPIFYLEG